MLIGHREIIENLKKLADSGKLSHGYIFFGPSMVGKKLVAAGLANYLENNAFESPRILIDYLLVVPSEEGSVGIDEARRVKEFLWRKPAQGTRRTVVIDDAHLLTTEAQNALLKIIEEPPPSALIILVTHDADALSPTVSSRLQHLYFSLVADAEIGVWAKEKFAAFAAKDVVVALRRGHGKPGLVAALVGDKKFQKHIEDATRALTTPAAQQSALIKKLLDAEEFKAEEFLDALVLVVSWDALERGDTRASFWHRALALRRALVYFNLNPRLQLESLLCPARYAPQFEAMKRPVV